MATPITPYLVYGTITDVNGTAIASSPVKLHSVTNDELIFTTTNSLGQYILDLANLNNGYSDGDSLVLYARNGTTYIGATAFTQSGEGGTEEDVATSIGGVTLGTIRDTSWKVIFDLLKTSAFAVSNTLTNSASALVNSTTILKSAMNDQVVKDNGYPLIILFPPVISKNGLTLKNGIVNCEINFLIEVYHNSAENVKILTDNVEDSLWRGQEILDGVGFGNLDMPDSSYDWYEEGKKKIHKMGINVNVMFDGKVSLP